MRPRSPRGRDSFWVVWPIKKHCERMLYCMLQKSITALALWLWGSYFHQQWQTAVECWHSYSLSPTKRIICFPTGMPRLGAGVSPFPLFPPLPHLLLLFDFLTGSIARSAKCRLFNLLRGRFWGFSPRWGDTLHRWGWNLARRRGPKVPSSVPNFTPIGATIRV